MQGELKLVKINSKYCDYLRKFDKKVPYNFAKKELRPFVGILFKVNDCQYFAPLSSPKPKHLKMKNNLDFLRLDEGKLGAINFNNMIPVQKENIILIDLNKNYKSIEKAKYQKLLKEQIYWLNRNKEKVYDKSKILYNKFISGKLNKKIHIRCCNFPLLEEKCIEYSKSIDKQFA